MNFTFFAANRAKTSLTRS